MGQFKATRHLALTEKMDEQLTEEAKRRKMSVAALVREYISAGLSAPPVPENKDKEEASWSQSFN